MMKARTKWVVGIAAFGTVYCSACVNYRIQGKLVHRCFIDENEQRQLTSRGGHRVGMTNISDMSGEAPPELSYYLFAPLRSMEGMFWGCYYRNGDVLRWRNPRRYH